MLCIAKKSAERRAGSRRDHVEAVSLSLLDALAPDDHVQGKPIPDRFKESALLGDRFDQGHPDLAAQQFRQDQRRETGAAAQIDQRPG